jgi:hypothetical protein
VPALLELLAPASPTAVSCTACPSRISWRYGRARVECTATTTTTTTTMLSLPPAEAAVMAAMAVTVLIARNGLRHKARAAV